LPCKILPGNLLYLRPGVKEAIQSCRDAGINVIMITGDVKETAESIA
jgi:Ca2+-transporting ATPase